MPVAGVRHLGSRNSDTSTILTPRTSMWCRYDAHGGGGGDCRDRGRGRGGTGGGCPDMLQETTARGNVANRKKNKQTNLGPLLRFQVGPLYKVFVHL
jgi:hypothetical protein